MKSQLLLCFLALLISRAFAATYYVDFTNGIDTIQRTGLSQPDAWRSIAFVLEHAEDATQIEIYGVAANGTNCGITFLNPITLHGNDGATVQCGETFEFAFSFEANSTVSGITFQGASQNELGSKMSVKFVSGLTLLESKFYDVREYGIVGYGSLACSNVEFVRGTHATAIFFADGSMSASDVRIDLTGTSVGIRAENCGSVTLHRIEFVTDYFAEFIRLWQVNASDMSEINAAESGNESTPVTLTDFANAHIRDSHFLTLNIVNSGSLEGVTFDGEFVTARKLNVVNSHLSNFARRVTTGTNFTWENAEIANANGTEWHIYSDLAESLRWNNTQFFNMGLLVFHSNVTFACNDTVSVFNNDGGRISFPEPGVSIEEVELRGNGSIEIYLLASPTWNAPGDSLEGTEFYLLGRPVRGINEYIVVHTLTPPIFNFNFDKVHWDQRIIPIANFTYTANTVVIFTLGGSYTPICDGNFFGDNCLCLTPPPVAGANCSDTGTWITGPIEVSPGGTVDLGSSVLFIEGNFTTSPGSTLEVTYKNGGAGGLNVTNCANLNGTLAIQFDEEPDGNFTLVNANCINGNFEEVVTKKKYPQSCKETSAEAIKDGGKLTVLTSVKDNCKGNDKVYVIVGVVVGVTILLIAVGAGVMYFLFRRRRYGAVDRAFMSRGDQTGEQLN